MADRPKRDSYEECCRAGRQALERAYEAQCTRKELRALGAVIALTVLYSRTWDWLYVQQIADFAHLHIVDARAALRKLRDLGVIVYEGKRHARSRIGLPLAEKRGEPASFAQFEKRGEPASQQRGDLADKRSRNASATEKYPEKTSEGRPNQTKTALDFIDRCYVCNREFPHKQLRPCGRCEACFQAEGAAA